jgi:signal transduction histidine kinase
MNRRHSVQYTRNVLFRGISRDLLRQAKITTTNISLAPGDIIFDEGDPPDYCYLVGSGAIRITKSLMDGQEELLAVIEPGDFFGEFALYDSSPRSTRATAAVPSRVGRLDQDAFDQLRRIAPLQVMSTLADRTIERVRQTNNRIVSELAAAGRLSSLGADLGIVVHDLKTPLATIRMATDAVHNCLDDAAFSVDDVRNFVEMIQRNADRGLIYIDYVLARLRGEAGDERTHVTVGDLLGELRQLCAGYLANPAVHYNDGQVSYHDVLLVDRCDFVDALANLVKNAIESLPAEGGDIEVAVAAEGRYVVFSVSDTGSGIDPQHLPLLFEKSFTHGKIGGTGLGLSHARAVAEKHGGRIYVESEVGRGTTIRIRIPRPTLAPAEPEQPDFSPGREDVRTPPVP